MIQRISFGLQLIQIRPVKEKTRPRQLRSPVAKSWLSYAPGVLEGWRSLRFFRNAMIGFPQRPQNENWGQANPAMISLSRPLISFLQLSHFLTSIDRESVISYGLRIASSALIRTAWSCNWSSCRRSCSAPVTSSSWWAWTWRPFVCWFRSKSLTRIRLTLTILPSHRVKHVGNSRLLAWTPAPYLLRRRVDSASLCWLCFCRFSITGGEFL